MNRFKLLCYCVFIIFQFLATETKSNNALIYAEQARKSCESSKELALKYAKNSVKLSELSSDTATMAICYYSLGVVYQEYKNYSQALESYQKATYLCECVDDNVTLNLVYNNIGAIYSDTEAYDLAIVYYEKAYDFAQIEADTIGIIYGLSNIANTYASEGNFVDANTYYLRAIAIAKTQHNSDYQIAYIENNLGYLNFLMEEYSNAIVHYKQALFLFGKEEYTYGQHAVLNRLAEAMLDSQQYDSSVYYLLRAEQLIDSNSDLKITDETYMFFYKTYKALSQTDSALLYYELSSIIQDSIESVEFAEYLSDLQSKYQNEKLKIDNELQTERINKQNVFIWFLITLAVFVVVSLILLLRQIIQKTRFSRTLEKRNRIISDQHNTITQSVEYAAHILNKGMNNNEIPFDICKDWFVWFYPRDRVGGDFYRIINTELGSLIAVADCTGHGVAGGFLATLGNQFLERAIEKIPISNPAEILSSINKQFVLFFGDNTELINESMDISLLFLGNNNKPVFSGNKQRLWVSKNEDIIEYRGDSTYLGYRAETAFSNQSIDIEQGNKIFLFTDGYADQFGGENKSKFKYSKFKQLISDAYFLNGQDTKLALINEHNNWIGSLSQTDDILVLGIFF